MSTPPLAMTSNIGCFHLQQPAAPQAQVFGSQGEIIMKALVRMLPSAAMSPPALRGAAAEVSSALACGAPQSPADASPTDQAACSATEATCLSCICHLHKGR
jgi:hypothetical protein